MSAFKLQPLTYTVQIGNSDDKLSQKRWSEFIDAVMRVIDDLQIEFPDEIEVHSWAYSNPAASWQNVTAVFNAPATRIVNEAVRAKLAVVAAEFEQDSIALTIGPTTFVKAAP